VVGTDGVEVVTAETPVPRPNEALVRVVVAGVCGSDTHAMHGRHPFVTLPYLPGHEVSGVVVGGAVLPIGQRVTVEPFLPCWNCKQCRAGRQNICENLTFFGCVHDQGGMADYFTLDVRRLHIVPDELDWPTAALIEPLSTPVHAVRLAGDLAGRAVVILGAGTIGLLLLRVALAHRARRIVVTDVRADKRERAFALGASAVVDAAAEDAVARVRAELGESADVVFDCVSVAATVQQAVALASKGGTVVIVGVPAGEVSVPLPIVQDHQVRIQGSATYLPEDYAESIELLRGGQVRAEDFVTAVLPLESVAAAFAQSGSGEQVKVLVAVDPESQRLV
jgi:2-desacetyl-2-hydroxyethyl bacteriochlorophyllide A dehydrogenase